jgi:hypothetical protein
MSRPTRLSTCLALAVATASLTAAPALARTHDHDRMLDRWEKRYHLNVKTDDSRRDRDRDGLSNYGEYRAHTDPRKKDSDHDGIRDGREDFDRDHLRNAAEIRTGFDPGKKDSDRDGTKDGRENAGKIVKLSDSSITIKLAVGGTLSARLGDTLAVHCTQGSASDAESAPDETGSDPVDDASDSAWDDVSADLPDSELPDDGTADAPDSWEDATVLDPTTGEDADAGDAAAFDEAFNHADTTGACPTTTLKVGATVHKAKVSRTASGPTVVSIKLFRARRK